MVDSRRQHPLAVGALLAVAAISPWLPAPEKRDPLARVGLAERIPARAGPWERVLVREVDPAQSANEMVEALFRAEDGSEVLLTLEYSSDQRRVHELHYPHICHRVRGDDLVLLPARRIAVGAGRSLPVFSFEWNQLPEGQRATCVFWLVLDDRATNDVAAVKWKQLWSGLLGHVHGGILVRLDALEPEIPDEESRVESAERADSMVRALFAGLRPEDRALLFGQGADI